MQSVRRSQERPFSLALAVLGVAALLYAALAIVAAEARSQEVEPASLTAAWQPVPAKASPQAVPQPAPPVPSPNPVPPHDDFATPPIDTGNTPPPPPPPAPVVPAPAPAPAPAPPVATIPVTLGHAKLCLESQGVPIIVGNTGNISFGATGAFPAPAAAAAPAPAAAPRPASDPTTAALVPVILTAASNPQTQSLALAALRRLEGALYYALTGRCPGSTTAAPAAAAAPVAASYVYLPVATVPVAAAPLPAAAPSPQVFAAPQYGYLAQPQAPPVAKKCWLFNH